MDKGNAFVGVGKIKIDKSVILITHRVILSIAQDDTMEYSGFRKGNEFTTVWCG